MEVCVDTKVSIPDNSANVKTSKSDSENKKSGDVFNSILQIKKILSSNDGESLESKLKALIAMLNKFSKKNLDFSDVNKLSGTANADNADNEISLKDISADTDEELMSMLSALINQLMTMIDNNEIAKGGSLSNLLDVSSLLDTKENKSTEKEQSTKDNIPADKSENLKNQSVDDINVNEIKDLIEKLSANLEDGKSTVKSEDTVKLQNLLKKLTEVVTNLEKQNPSKKSSDQGILNFVKPQLSMEKSNTNTNTSIKNVNLKDNSNVDEEKLLKKISGKQDTDNNQGFSNLLTKMTNSAKDISTATKPAEVVINKNNFAEDVIKTVKYMEKNDIKDLTVKVNPKELGEVVIKLVQEGNTMKATITAANKETFQILNSNIQEISNKISSNNTSIQSFAVDIFNGDSSNYKQNSGQNDGNNKGNKANHLKIDDIEDAGTEGTDYYNNNVNILA